MITRTERLRSQLGAEMEHLLETCLTQETRGGDAEAAWNSLLEAVRQMAFDLGRWTYHLGMEDAEDVAQLAQLRVLERLPQLRRPAAFPLWVRRIVHHVVLDTLRQRRPLLSLDALDDPDEILAAARAEFGPEAESGNDYDRVLLRMDLDQALSRLPDLYREPIQLHVLEGMPQDEVGRQLGRPRSTVATQIERGLHRLRRTLPSLAGVQ
jgi:RNA polymerase sigma-70 factor (ECF subfamily)